MDESSGIELHLTDEEAAILADYVQDDLDNLRGEVYRTEDYDYRQDLKHREGILRAILERLPVRTA